MNYTKGYHARQVGSGEIQSELRSIESEFLRISRHLRSVFTPGETVTPWYDIRTFGASGGADDAQAFRDAGARANLNGGGIVLVPPGIWTTGCPDTISGVKVTVPIYDNVWYWGMPGSTIKFKDGISTALSPTPFSFLAASTYKHDVGVFGIDFDFNGANNPTSNLMPHSIINFIGNAGKGEDITIAKCKGRNSAGCNMILTSSQINHALHVMGKRWYILANYFLDNGLSVDDFSAIWAWADECFILDNVFEEAALPVIPSPPDVLVKCAYEIHGARSKASRNIARNYTQLAWIAPNFLHDVAHVEISHETIENAASFGIRFYRSTGGLTEYPIYDVSIDHLQVTFGDDYPGDSGFVGVQLNTTLGIYDVHMSHLDIRRPSGGTQYAVGVMLACAGAGEAYDRIEIADSFLEGMTYGIFAISGAGGGSIQCLRAHDNFCLNMRENVTFTHGVGIYGTFDATLPCADWNLTDNQFRNDENPAGNANYGIYMTGSFDIARAQDNHFANMVSGNCDYGTAAITLKYGSDLP